MLDPSVWLLTGQFSAMSLSVCISLITCRAKTSLPPPGPVWTTTCVRLGTPPDMPPR